MILSISKRHGLCRRGVGEFISLTVSYVTNTVDIVKLLISLSLCHSVIVLYKAVYVSQVFFFKHMSV